MILFISLTGIFISAPVISYELATHGAITQKVYENSILAKDPQLLKNFGVNTSTKNLFGSIYYDMSGSLVRLRKERSFEENIMEKLGLKTKSLCVVL